MHRWVSGELTMWPEGIPNRQLLLRGEITHEYSGALTNIQPFVEVSIAGVRVFQGEVYSWRAKEGLEGLVEAYGTIEIEIPVSLSSHDLAAVEEQRAGQDAEILIKGRVRSSIAHRIPNQGHHTAGETRFHDIQSPTASTWTRTVARSDWLKILETLDWRITELMELPLPLEGNRSALEHLNAARRHLALGEWAEVLGRCYRALEASLPEPKAFKDSLGPQLTTDAQDALDIVIRKAKKFFQEGRHHREGFPDVSEREARLAVLLTCGIVQYLR